MSEPCWAGYWTFSQRPTLVPRLQMGKHRSRDVPLLPRQTTFYLPAAAAATVAGEAPASLSWFCSEKSMLYHSAVRSAGLGGMIRLGFSRTSKTCRVSRGGAALEANL